MSVNFTSPLFSALCAACGHECDGRVLKGEETPIKWVRTAVQERLQAAGRLSPALEREIGRMVQSCAGEGASVLRDLDDDLIAQYVGEVTYRHGEARFPSASKQQTRRWAASTFFAEARRLGLTDRAVAVDVQIEHRPVPGVRPLTDDEMVACQDASYRTIFETRFPAVLAVAQAGADAIEIARVTWSDIDVDCRSVHLRGVSQRYASRTNLLTTWGSEAIKQLLLRKQDASPDEPVVMEAADTPAHSATASIAKVLRQILNQAGIEDHSVRPRSIRAWAGLKVWERTQDYAEVARFLGTPSLDTAAATIGVDWR